MNCYYCPSMLTVEEYAMIGSLKLCCNSQQSFCLKCLFDRKKLGDLAMLLDKCAAHRETLVCITCQRIFQPAELMQRRYAFREDGYSPDRNIRGMYPAPMTPLRGHQSVRYPPDGYRSQRQQQPFEEQPMYQSFREPMNTNRFSSRGQYPPPNNSHMFRSARVQPSGGYQNNSFFKSHGPIRTDTRGIPRSDIQQGSVRGMSYLQVPQMSAPHQYRTEPIEQIKWGESDKMELDEDFVSGFNSMGLSEPSSSPQQQQGPVSTEYRQYIANNGYSPQMPYRHPQFSYQPNLPQTYAVEPRPIRQSLSPIKSNRMATSVLYTEPIDKNRQQDILLDEQSTVAIARPPPRPPTTSHSSSRLPPANKSISPYTTDDYYKNRANETKESLSNLRSGNNFGFFKTQPKGQGFAQRPVSADIARK